MRIHVSVTSSPIEDYKANCEYAIVPLDEKTTKVIKDIAEVAKTLAANHKTFNRAEFYEELCYFLDVCDASDLFAEDVPEGIIEVDDKLIKKIKSKAQRMESVLLSVDERYFYFVGRPNDADFTVESDLVELKELEAK
jgi:hypothetical protein